MSKVSKIEDIKFGDWVEFVDENPMVNSSNGPVRAPSRRGRVMTAISGAVFIRFLLPKRKLSDLLEPVPGQPVVAWDPPGY